jgi:hypothetical protein
MNLEVDPVFAIQTGDFIAIVCEIKRISTVDRKFEISDIMYIRTYIWRREQLQVDYDQ